MNTDTLHIIDDIFPSLEEDAYVVCLQNNDTQTYKNEIALLELFYEKQEMLKEELLVFQSEVFKKIESRLDDKSLIGYILSSLFFEKSPYKTDSMYLFFKLRLIISVIETYKIETLYVYSSKQSITTFFQKFAQIASKKIIVKEASSKELSFKEKVMQNGLLSFGFKVLQEYKKQKFTKQQQTKKKLVVSYYPSYFFQNNHFISKYFADVSYMLSQEYEWLFIYAGEKSKLYEEDQYLKKNGFREYNFLDNYISISDFGEIYHRYSVIKQKLKHLDMKTFFVYEGVDFFPVMENDMKKSFGVVLIDTLFFEKRFENYFSHKKYEEVLYLMEYQPWEQMLNKVLKINAPESISKGVTHSVIRPNLLNYMYPENIHNKMFLPDYVGANGEFIQHIYQKNGFKKEQIFPIEAQRFLYLSDEKQESTQHKALLITTSIDFKETQELLEFFAKAYTEKIFEKIYIKAHPDLPVDTIIKEIDSFPEYSIVSGSMQDAFAKVDVVYSANSSSVLLEALMNGKKTLTIFSLTSLPMPAVQRHPLLYIATTIEKLHNIFLTIYDNQIFSEKQNMDDVLFLDKELALWKRFIDVK